MSEWYTAQQLKEDAVNNGDQFVQVVMAGSCRVMIIGRWKTQIYEMGSGNVVDSDAALYLTHTLPTTFEFPSHVMPVYKPSDAD